MITTLINKNRLLHLANLTKNGKQCTICWYVESNKISHKDPKVIDEVVGKIANKFGHISKTVGDEHDFLGMHLKYKNKKVEIIMKKHMNSWMTLRETQLIELSLICSTSGN